MKKFIIQTYFLVFSFVHITAQDPNELWSIERCINYAHENNLQVKRQYLNVDLAKEDLNQSYYEVLPKLNGGFDHQFSNGRSLNIEAYKWENTRKQQGSIGISSDLTLFNGFRNLNSIQYKKYSFLSAQEDLEKVKNDITLSIATAYLQILFNEEILNVARSQYEVTLLQVNKISRLVEVGNLSKGELLQIKAQAASEKLNVATSQNVLNMAVLELTQILDLDSIGNFRISHPENLSVESMGVPEAVGDIFKVAVASLPEIKSSEYSVKMAEKYLAYEKGLRSPSLTMGGLYYSRYLKGAYNPLDPGIEYFYKDQLKNNQYSQLSLGLDIPVFNRMKTQTTISKARIRLEDSQFELDQKMQLLYKTIQQLHGNALAALEKYYSGLEAVTSDEEVFKYTQQKYDVGLVNSVDYNISKNNLLKAKSDLLQAKYEFIFRMKIIDFYKGKAITL
jgi:outer membrane protein